jgi:antirestriction protein ArdC
MPKRKPLTDAEREELRRKDRERLEQAIRQLQTSEGWRAWLRARAALHTYSLNNSLLISLQAHQRGFAPTHVAGFKTWLTLGRCVRQGEKSLRILAPITAKRHDDEHEDDHRPVYFRPAHVFDISQTDPLPDVEPAPLEPPSAPIQGDSHAHLLLVLQALAAELGYTVTYELLGRDDGLCNRAARRIRIRRDLAPNGRVATLIHELAHALIDSALKLSQALEEVVVEAVTYIVCAGVGLDSGCDSVPYIAGWGAEDAAEQIAHTSKLIDTLARRIEAALPTQDMREAA